MEERTSAEQWIIAHWGYLLWIVRHQHHIPDGDAEDVVQDACLKLWLKWDTWQDRGKGRDPWAAQIAGNVARDWWRYQEAQRRDWHRTLSLDSPFTLPNIVSTTEEPNSRRSREAESTWLCTPGPSLETLVQLRHQIRALWAELNDLDRQLVRAIAAGYQMKDCAAQEGTTALAIKAKWHRLRLHARALNDVVWAD